MAKKNIKEKQQLESKSVYIRGILTDAFYGVKQIGRAHV